MPDAETGTYTERDADRFGSALYLRGDRFESSDAVFGVKKTLVVDLHKVDETQAKKYDVKPGIHLLRQDFVLVSQKESDKLREERSREALQKLGSKVKFLDGLPIPDVD